MYGNSGIFPGFCPLPEENVPVQVGIPLDLLETGVLGKVPSDIPEAIFSGNILDMMEKLVGIGPKDVLHVTIGHKKGNGICPGIVVRGFDVWIKPVLFGFVDLDGRNGIYLLSIVSKELV